MNICITVHSPGGPTLSSAHSPLLMLMPHAGADAQLTMQWTDLRHKTGRKQTQENKKRAVDRFLLV